MSTLEPIYKMLRDHEIAAHKLVAEVKHATESLLYDPEYIETLLRASQLDATNRLVRITAVIRLTTCNGICKEELKRLTARSAEVFSLWQRVSSTIDVKPVIRIPDSGG